MKRPFSKLILLWLVPFLCSCSPHETKTSEDQNDQRQTDSLTVLHSGEYLRVIAFLEWYKEGHDKLYLPGIEHIHRDEDSFYAYVDTLEAKALLERYRESGYFSEKYLLTLSNEIEEGQKTYRNRDLDVYDYFDHDFILLTQETESCLKAVPAHISPLVKFCKPGEIALSIRDCGNLKFTLRNEKGILKIDRIENLGIIR